MKNMKTKLKRLFKSFSKKDSVYDSVVKTDLYLIRRVMHPSLK